MYDQHCGDSFDLSVLSAALDMEERIYDFDGSSRECMTEALRYVNCA